MIPFGISDVALRPVFHLGAFLYGGVPVFEISEFTNDGEMLVRTPQLGDALAKMLGDKRVALMRGQATAIGLGGKVRYLSDAEGDNVTNRQPGNIARVWELWKERAKGK